MENNSNKKVLIEQIRTIQMITLNMLCSFDDFCKAENLSYSMAGGTLLGAVRHGGFIPWDDDIDLFMLRPDYEKLLEIAGKKSFSDENLALVHVDAGEPGISWARLIDRRTEVIHDTTSSFRCLWLDILPVDAVPDTAEKRKAYGRKLKRLRRIRLLYNANMLAGKTKLRAIVKTPIVFLLNLFGSKEKCSRKIIQKSQSVPYDAATYVAEIVAQGDNIGLIHKDTFTSSVMMSFEGREFPAVPDWDFYLRSRYGDTYMQLPPEEDRMPHAIKVWVDADRYEPELRSTIF